MPRAKRAMPIILEIDRADIINRLAWLRWQGLDDQARGVVDLCAWMSPAFRPEDHEPEIAARIAQLEASHQRKSNPTEWD